MPPLGDLSNRDRFPVSVEFITTEFDGLIAQVVFDFSGSDRSGSNNVLTVGTDEHLNDKEELMGELAVFYGFSPHYDRPAFVPD